MKLLVKWFSVACSLLATGALGQSYVVGPPVTQAYAPLTGGTAIQLQPESIFPAEDEGAATLSLGFSFPFYGNTYTSVIVHSNGMLLFGNPTICNGTTGGSACYINTDIPHQTRAFHNVIAAWWDDLDGNNATSVVRYVKPSASEIVIEWFDWNYLSGSGSFSFQVKLNASGVIQVHYGSHTGSPNGVSAGFENATGTQGAKLLSCTPNCTGANWPTNQLYTIGQPVQPDLVVQDVALANMVNGQNALTFTVTPTFRNFGQNAASNFLWRAYLSTDKVYQPSDQLIFTASVPVSVAGGSTATASGNASVSPKPGPGQYFVIVEADHTNAVNEFSESNNYGSTASYFTQGVDLVATAISGPANSGPGNNLSVQVQWFNQGTDAAGTVQYTVWLSTDTALSGGDFNLYSGTKNVTGGQTINETVTFQVPATVPGGDFYYLLEVDSGKAVAEASETNNVVASAAQVKMEQADLTLQSVVWADPTTGNPTTVGYFGQQGRMTVVANNIGGADARNFKVGVVLSRDTNLSLLTDTVLHDEAVTEVLAGQSKTISFTLNVPLKDKNGADFGTGPYYVFAMLDSFREVGELNETNNSGYVGPITFKAPAQDYTVLRVEGPASAAVGETIPVFRVIKNIGNVDGTSVSYRLYASANDIITPDDIPLAIVGPNGQTNESGTLSLAKGDENAATELVRLPPTMPPGTFYVGVIVDVGGAAQELDEQNNATPSTSTTQVAPASLRITTTQLPDGTVGRPYSFRLVAVGENGPSSWSVDPRGGTLPDGLTLATDGTLSGTPTTSVVSAFTAMVQNSGRSAAARLVLRVLPPTTQLEITTRSLPPVVNSPGTPYQAALSAAGGVRPYTWSISAGELPAGIALDAQGTLTGSVRPGTPLSENLVTFEVADAVGSRSRAQIKVRVIEPGAIFVKTLAVPDSLVGSDYVTDLVAANANDSPLARPLTWSVASGVLPDGLSLTSDGERGVIRGKPLIAGTYPFSIQVEDAKGRSDVADFILRVFPARLKLTAQNAPSAIHPGDTVDISLVAGGSGGAVRFRLHSGALPPGLSLDESGTISGTVATENAVGTYNFVVEARDQPGGSGLGAFTLEVVESPRSAGCNSVGGSGLGALMAAFGALLFRRRRAALASAAALVMAASVANAQVQYTLESPKPVAYANLPLGSPVAAIQYYYSSASIPIGFDFKFYGQSYSAVQAWAHGLLSFVGGTE